jgi:hypothetical protein
LVLHLRAQADRDFPRADPVLEAAMSVRTLSPRHPRENVFPVERRYSQRRACLREIACRGVMAENEEGVPALLVELSNGGLRLVLRRGYEPGRALAVSWRETLHGVKRTLLAHVVHVNNQGSGNWVVGCALNEALNEDEVTALL